MNGKLLAIAGAAAMGLNRRCWRKQGRAGMERAMGFEPTTLCLGSKYSTTELHPPATGQSHCNTSQAVCHQGNGINFQIRFQRVICYNQNQSGRG